MLRHEAARTGVIKRGAQVRFNTEALTRLHVPDGGSVLRREGEQEFVKDKRADRSRKPADRRTESLGGARFKEQCGGPEVLVIRAVSPNGEGA